jgi:tetratricopeptide (TPR) repeat protein
MQKAKKKFTKKELKQDKFVTATFKAQSVIRENKQDATKYLAAIMIVFALYFAYNYFSGEDLKEASAALSKGQTMMAAGNIDNGLLQLEQTAFGYSNNSSAMAALLVARYYFDSKNYDTVATYLDLAIDGASDPYVLYPTYVLYGNIFLKEGKYAEAAEHYEKALTNAATRSQEAEALFNIGYAHTQAGDNSRAQDVFDRLAEEHPDSKYTEDAKLLAVQKAS